MSATPIQMEIMLNFMEVPISELEEKAIQMTSLRVSVAGSSSKCFGASYKADTEPDDIENQLRAITKSPVEVSEDIEAAQLGKRPATYLNVSTLKRGKQSNKENGLEKLQILKSQVETDKKFQMDILNVLTERNRQEAVFHRQVIQLLEMRNEIAEKQLQENKQNKN